MEFIHQFRDLKSDIGVFNSSQLWLELWLAVSMTVRGDAEAVLSIWKCNTITQFTNQSTNKPSLVLLLLIPWNGMALSLRCAVDVNYRHYRFDSSSICFRLYTSVCILPAEFACCWSIQPRAKSLDDWRHFHALIQMQVEGEYWSFRCCGFGCEVECAFQRENEWLFMFKLLLLNTINILNYNLFALLHEWYTLFSFFIN